MTRVRILPMRLNDYRKASTVGSSSVMPRPTCSQAPTKGPKGSVGQ